MWWIVGVALAAEFGVSTQVPDCDSTPQISSATRCAGGVCLGWTFEQVEQVLGACDDPKISADLRLKTDELEERSLRCRWKEHQMSVAVRGGAVRSIFVRSKVDVDGLSVGDSIDCAKRALGEPDRVDLRKRAEVWTIDAAHFGPIWVSDDDGDGTIDKISLHGR